MRGSRHSRPVTWHDGPPAGAELVEPLLPELMAVIGQTALPAERLARAPQLEAVLNVEGNFLPNVDYAACFARGIEVLGIGPVFGQPVAELALGMALAAARDIPRGDAEIRAGTETMFDDGVNGGSFLLAGKTVGLVGCGNLARSLLPLLRPVRLRAARARSLAPRRCADGSSASSRSPSSSSSPAARSSSSSPPSRPRTSARSAAACFDAMAPGSVVVLVSRAAVVDWPALLDAAARGHIRAAIDVFPEEPIPAAEPARSTPGTILSAHRAGNVPEIWRQVGEMVADDLEALAAGREPQRMQRADPLTVERLRSRPIG